MLNGAFTVKIHSRSAVLFIGDQIGTRFLFLRFSRHFALDQLDLGQSPGCARQRWQPRRGSMKFYAPNIALFVVAGCLAMLGVLAALPISLPIPGLTANSSWYIFLAWFLLAAGTVVPHQDNNNAE
jgi:hypothetical protein